MKKKYMVGFFLALFCMVLLVSAGYAASYRYVMQRQEARVEEAPGKSPCGSPWRTVSRPSSRRAMRGGRSCTT